MSADVSLADELNTFYARFEAATKNARTVNANSAISCKQAHLRAGREESLQESRRTRRQLGSCPQTLCRPASTYVYRIFNPFLISFPQWLSPCRPDFNVDEVFWVAGQRLHHLFSAWHSRSILICLLCKLFNRWCHLTTPSQSLNHLDIRKGKYVKMIFVGYSSAFNTIIPSTLNTKLEQLRLSPSLSHCICNFLTVRPHWRHWRWVNMCQPPSPQHWRTSWVCSEPPAVLSVHVWPLPAPWPLSTLVSSTLMSSTLTTIKWPTWRGFEIWSMVPEKQSPPKCQQD